MTRGLFTLCAPLGRGASRLDGHLDHAAGEHEVHLGGRGLEADHTTIGDSYDLELDQILLGDTGGSVGGAEFLPHGDDVSHVHPSGSRLAPTDVVGGHVAVVLGCAVHPGESLTQLLGSGGDVVRLIVIPLAQALVSLAKLLGKGEDLHVCLLRRGKVVVVATTLLGLGGLVLVLVLVGAGLLLRGGSVGLGGDGLDVAGLDDGHDVVCPFCV